VDDVFLARRDRVRIEDDEVGGHARLHEPAVVDAERRGRVVRESPHRVLERHDLLLAHPVAEQPRRVTETRIVDQMRAGRLTEIGHSPSQKGELGVPKFRQIEGEGDLPLKPGFNGVAI